ncbi:hypothetical protein GGI24_000447 [Coemansia furcata]|nr:hypothetical protein GGI24_000447 [Coemansia furcata]
MIVLVAGIITALLALGFGGKDYAWSSPTILSLLIFGIAIVDAFVVIEWRFPAEPIMPLWLLAISAGLHLLPYILPISIFSTISGFVVAKARHYHELLWVGRSITTVSTRLFVLLDESTSTGKSIDLALIGGAGVGLLIQPMQQNYTC